MRKFALPIVATTCLAFAALGCKSTPAPTSENKPAPEPTGPRVYATNEVSGDLTIIDIGTAQTIANVHLGKRPRGIHASADGKQLYIALSGTPIAGPGVDESTLPPPDHSADGIAIFDLATRKIVRTIPGGSDPENFDVSKDGKKLFISNEDISAVSIIDIESGTVEKSFKIGSEPEGVKVSPDGKEVWVTSEGTGEVSVLDPEKGKIIATIKVGHRPRNIAFLPDGKTAFVNAENDGNVVVVDVTKHKMTKTIKLGEPGVIKPMYVLLSPDASKLYVSTGRGKKVFAINTKDDSILGSVEVGQRPWGMALSPDEKTLFTANGPSNDVSFVDLASFTVTHKAKASGGPWGLVALP